MATLQELMAQKKAAIAQQSGRRIPTVRPTAGTSRFRILPSWRGAADPIFYHDFGQHFIKDSKGKTMAVYVCVDKTFAKPCAVCDAISEGIFSATTDDDKKLLKEANASGRVLVNALQVDKDVKTPVILELSPTTFDKCIDIYQANTDDENPDFNILTDISAGVDIIITRTGTGINTEYSVQPAIKGNKPVDASVLTRLNNLDEYVAQEYEQGLLKATSAVRAAIGGAQAKALPSSKDAEFDEDVPHHAPPKLTPAAGTDDILEGDFEAVNEGGVSDDELNALLDDLDD